MTDAELKDLKESVDKLHAALPALFAFRDKFELWAKETGIWDHLVQDVLGKVPPAIKGPKGDKGDKGDPGTVVYSQAPSGPVDASDAAVLAVLQRAGLLSVDGTGRQTGLFREIHLKAGQVSHIIGNSENDSGLTVAMNADYGRGWRAGSAHTDPRLPIVIERFEQDGVWSIRYEPPDLVPNPNIEQELGNGPYDLPGKSLVVRGQGWSTTGQSGETIVIGSGQVGRGVEIRMVPEGGSPNWPNGTGIKILPEGVFVVDPDGTERKL